MCIYNKKDNNDNNDKYKSFLLLFYLKLNLIICILVLFI